MQKIHFITYGDFIYHQEKKRLVEEAKKIKLFDSIKAYSRQNLDKAFKAKFKHILLNARGGGFWIWKPYIIKKRLEEINNGDILVYLDAGCSINIAGKKRLFEYLQMLNQSKKGIIAFHMQGFLEKEWTTKEIFNYFNIDLNADIANSPQFIAGILIMQKNKYLLKIVDEWYNVLYQNSMLFTNFYNDHQIPEFQENRHDQSILSVIMKKNKINAVNDETYFTSFGSQESLFYPFWATRKLEKKYWRIIVNKIIRLIQAI